jgi:hypothetical protein
VAIVLHDAKLDLYVVSELVVIVVVVTRHTYMT